MSCIRRIVCFALIALGFTGPARAAADVVSVALPGSDFRVVRETLIETIESEGLNVREAIPFNKMLQRTASAYGKARSPFAEAEIVEFCSGAIAWQLLAEDRDQIALCPMAISIRAEAAGEGGELVTLAYRSPGQATAGRQAAERLLHKILNQVAASVGAPPVASR